MSSHIRQTIANGVLTLTLDRRNKKNALTREMYQTLAAAIDAAEFDGDIRCVLIQAEGDTFTAGNDIGDFAATAAGGPRSDGPPAGNPFLTALARAKTPLVAAVNGRAVGIGVTMLFHCDLVYVAEDALLTTPFVDLALVPEAASTLTAPARIGHVRAFSMFVLGQAVDAGTAVDWGIANAVTPVAALHRVALEAAEAVAARAPESVTLTKTMMRDAQALEERIRLETAHFADRLRSPEAREAFAAFAEKRPRDSRRL